MAQSNILTPAELQKQKIQRLLAQAQANMLAVKKEKQKEKEKEQEKIAFPILVPGHLQNQGWPIQLENEKEKKIFDSRKQPFDFSTLPVPEIPVPTIEQSTIQSQQFQWNKEQQAAIDLAVTGKEFCFIGAAGTGKSTTERGMIQALIQHNRIPPMKSSTKHLKAGQPSIVITAFTRAAVKAARRNLSADIPCITIHKLLEYEPIFYDIKDPETGMMRKTMRFEPQRGLFNPITELRYVVIDESSMCDVDLHKKLKEACPNAIFIYVGDIQQLPPVYGSAILGYKLLELPTIELTQVYRQALESPIIKLAHRILSGKALPPSEVKEYEKPGELKFHYFKKRVQGWDCQVQVKKFFSELCKSGTFNPVNTVILIPFNEEFGTIELNKGIAQTLGEMNNAIVYEIIAGFKTHYFAVGDRILVDKQEGIIKEIIPNQMYAGKKPHKESKFLNRWGHYTEVDDSAYVEESKMSEEEIDRIITLTSATDDDERKNQASHVLKVAPIVDGDSVEEESLWWQLKTAGEINNTLFSYALTVHKSQGSEWENVYFIMHNSHYTMCNREMLYTACTRARKNLYIICDGRSQSTRTDSAFEVGIERQRIKGNTLAEKAEYFKGKLEGNLELAEKLR